MTGVPTDKAVDLLRLATARRAVQPPGRRAGNVCAPSPIPTRDRAWS
jgi:hypothetical protein